MCISNCPTLCLDCRWFSNAPHGFFFSFPRGPRNFPCLLSSLHTYNYKQQYTSYGQTIFAFLIASTCKYAPFHRLLYRMLFYSGIATIVLLSLRNFLAHRLDFIINHFAPLRFDHDVLVAVGSPVEPVVVPDVVLFWLLLIYTFSNLQTGKGYI